MTYFIFLKFFFEWIYQFVKFPATWLFFSLLGHAGRTINEHSIRILYMVILSGLHISRMHINIVLFYNLLFTQFYKTLAQNKIYFCCSFHVSLISVWSHVYLTREINSKWTLLLISFAFKKLYIFFKTNKVT